MNGLWGSGIVFGITGPVLWIYYRALKDSDRRRKDDVQELDARFDAAQKTFDRRMTVMERKIARCEQDRSLLIQVAIAAKVEIPESVFESFNPWSGGDE